MTFRIAPTTECRYLTLTNVSPLTKTLLILSKTFTGIVVSSRFIAPQVEHVEMETMTINKYVSCRLSLFVLQIKKKKKKYDTHYEQTLSLLIFCPMKGIISFRSLSDGGPCLRISWSF